MRQPVVFDGRNIYNPEQMKAHGFTYYLDWAVTGRRPRHRRRRATSAATRPRRWRAQGAASSSTTTCRPGTARPRSASPRSCEGDIARRGGRCARSSGGTASTAVMHFAAWLSVGESVRDPAGYYRNNVVGTLSVLEAMAAESVSRLRLLVDLRGVRRAGGDADRRRRTRRGRSTPTARRSWPSSARCRTSSAPTASARSCCGISTRPAPIRRASSARITRRRST